MIGLAPPDHDPDAPQTLTTLPVGSPATVRHYVGGLIRRHRGAFTVLIIVNAAAVIASMAGLYLLGGVVEKLSAGARDLQLEQTIAVFAVALAAQTVFVRTVRLRGAVLGERMLADLREDFLVRSVALPPGVLGRPAPAICCRGSPRTSTGSPDRCARPYRNWPSAWCGWAC